MPRDIKKLKELEQIINKKDLELAKYKQLVNSIQGLITINGIKLNEDDYKDLFYNDIGRDRKASTYNLSDDELAEALGSRLNKKGYRLLITNIESKPQRKDKEERENMKGDWEEEKLTQRGEKPKPQPKKCINCQEVGNWEGRSFCPKCEVKEGIKETKPDWVDENDEADKDLKEKLKTPPKTHVDELRELQKKGKTKPSEMKRVRKQPHALEELREEATKATATENQNLTMEERIAKLPPEAQAVIRANQAREKAAESKKHHGQEGDREYRRLMEKEAKERGEIPTDGTCPNCSEKLEAPIVRGYHQECWEAKQKKEGNA